MKVGMTWLVSPTTENSGSLHIGCECTKNGDSALMKHAHEIICRCWIKVHLGRTITTSFWTLPDMHDCCPKSTGHIRVILNVYLQHRVTKRGLLDSGLILKQYTWSIFSEFRWLWDFHLVFSFFPCETLFCRHLQSWFCDSCTRGLKRKKNKSNSF